MVSTRNRRRIVLQGNLRQKRKNGQFYYRLYVSKGVRKEFALKTSDPDEAVNKAFDLDSLWLAPTAEVAYAQMKAIRGFSKMAGESRWRTDGIFIGLTRIVPHRTLITNSGNTTPPIGSSSVWLPGKKPSTGQGEFP